MGYNRRKLNRGFNKMHSKRDIELQDVSSHDLTEKFNLEQVTPPPIETKSRLGIYLRIAAGITGATVGLIRKEIPDVPAMTLLFDRGFISLIMIVTYFHYIKNTDELKQSFNRLIVSVGSCAAIGDCLGYMALSVLPMSDFMTIMGTVAIFNGIGGALILGEPYLRFEKVLGALSFLGVFFIVRPPFIFGSEEVQQVTESDTPPSMSRFVAALVALFVCILYSWTQIGIRKLGGKGHKLLVAFHVNFAIVTIFGTYILLFGRHGSLTLHEITFIVLSAVIHTGGVILSTMAFSIEKPGVLGVVGYLDLVTGTIGDMIFFGVYPTFFTVLGASIIIASCIQLIRMKQ